MESSWHKQLDFFTTAMSDKHRLEAEVTQREQQIAQLQEIVSDLEMFLCEERDHVRRICAENDILKMKEIALRDELEGLSQAALPPPPRHVSPRHVSPRHVSPRHLSPRRSASNISHISHVSPTKSRPSPRGVDDRERRRLQLQIASLTSQVEQMMTASRDQLDIVKDNAALSRQEAQNARTKNGLLIESLTARLQHTEKLLLETTRELVQSRRESRVESRDVSQDQSESRDRHVKPTNKDNTLDMLRNRVEKLSQLRDGYKEQCITLESRLVATTEELQSAQDTIKRLKSKHRREVSELRSQVERLSRRRQLEVEGQRSDVRLMQDRVKELEKQLAQMVVVMSEDREKEAMMYESQRKAHLSNILMNEIVKVKSKIRGLESHWQHGV